MAKGKHELQKRALKLRETGNSVNQIAYELQVSKSSVSRWVRNVGLTDEQIRYLSKRDATKAQNINKENAKRDREKWQKEGADRIHERDFIAGCMLYWGEGDKNRNVLGFTNCDKNMIQMFAKFLRQTMGVNDDEFKMEIRCYSGGPSIEDIERYWREVTSLEMAPVHIRVNSDKRHGSGKKIKHPYGICRLKIFRTDVVQQIFGGIQAYVGSDIEEWAC